MFSIIIPTFNNINYLKFCIKSLRNNSCFDHEIIIHINDGSDGTNELLKKNKIKYTFSESNLGLCTSINKAVKLSTTNYILYSHDDMYFCPDWDKVLLNEIKKIKHEKFYLGGTMIQPSGAHISLDCGNSVETFNENKLLKDYQNHNFFNHQGTHFAPHLVTKNMWNKVGGFSEEFNPGIASDPDFNMKLWKEGVRIFKGLNDFKVYHFGSQTTRKNLGIKKNRGDLTFIKKWGISVKFFKKYYLKTNSRYESELTNPIKDIYYYKDLIINKIYYFIIKILNK